MTDRIVKVPRPGGAMKLALDAIERIGNRLPAPATLFVLLAALVLIASWVAAKLGVSVIHPKDGSTVAAVNLLDHAGIRRVFTEAVKNFMGFAPLGTVLVAMLGVGVAEGSGLFSVALRALVTSMPRSLLTATVVFAGIIGHTAADAGIVVLPPIAAMLFAAAGRHPLAGMAAAFAGVAGGFSANFIPTPLDVLLAGLSQEAVDASRLMPGYVVQLLGNWFFLSFSAPLLTLIGTWVTHRFVEPRLGPWKGAEAEALDSLTREERRGLVAAGVALAATIVGFFLLAGPAGAPLRTTGASLIQQLKPFFDSLIVLVMLFFFIPGLAYGLASGKVRNDHDVARMTGDTMATMGTYIVLAFAAAQFVSWFGWSNLGSILAISGANLLKSVGFQGGLLLVAFVVLSAFINLFIASASAKWAIMAPVFVPMFLLLGFRPEATQVVYRIGDSSTNIITPLMPYMPFILTYARRYDPKSGSGTIIAMMLPYSIAFLIFWTAQLLLFYALGWPIGPGVHMRLSG